MAAYIIAEVEITDPVKYASYVEIVPATIAAFGGRFLARGGRSEALEGAAPPKRVVILEFPTYERAREWWSSEQYSGPRALRQSSSIGRLILVEGV